jgi:hypothetical protein
MNVMNIISRIFAQIQYKLRLSSYDYALHFFLSSIKFDKNFVILRYLIFIV